MVQMRTALRKRNGNDTCGNFSAAMCMYLIPFVGV